MTMLLTALAGVTAVAAAVRSTWSPCGQSMLSTITPLAEGARDRSFRRTAVWFVGGAVLGGLCLGAGMAVAAAGVRAAFGSASAGSVTVAAGCALLAASLDARWLGLRAPGHCRQVNELWLNRYRPWVYGAGFGWQIGTGLATFIMTAGVYLMVVVGALTASPAIALAVGGLFGLVRGLGVVPARTVTSPERLRAFHRRFDALGPFTRAGMIGVQLAVAAAAAVRVGGPTVLGAIAVVGLAALAATGRRGLPARRAPTASAR